MRAEVKNIVDGLMDVAVKAAANSKDPDGQEKKIRRLAHKEILSFLLYLSASDGSIEVQEALFIKDYLDEQISPEEMCQKIEEENIYSKTFEERAPLVLKKLVKLDNANYEKDGKLEESEAEKYICLYEALGMEFTACDREMAQSEKDDLNTYINNMRSFYRANYQGPEEATKASHSEHTMDVETVRNQQKKSKPREDEDGEETLEELMEQLNALIGLRTVKATVNQLIHFNAIKQIREERGLDRMPMTKHMVFYGNPGTGKTTVARLIAKIYHKLGLLSKGHLVEVDRSGLVAGYVGHTALKVNEVVKKAMGGVLFIDEAYALTYKRSENDFGWEAVDTLTKAMEDYRDDLVIIVAGYPKRMASFIDSNPGFKSRFNRFIQFPDYDGAELFGIYKKMLADVGFTADEEVMSYTEEYLEDQAEDKGENFANARLVRNYLETSIMNQADRLYAGDRDSLSDEELCTIEIEDVESIE